MAVKKKVIKKKVIKKIVKKKVIKKIAKRITIKRVKTSSRPLVPSITQESRAETEIAKPSSWLRAVQKNENVNSSYIWSINKEKIYEDYVKKYIKTYDNGGNEVLTKISDYNFSEPKNDYMRVFSEQVLVLPNGKIITPIRQFCETKILPAGTKEAFFYDFGSVLINPVDEGDFIPTLSRGTRITVGYQQTEESPMDIVESINRAFALESINDETKQVLNAFNTMKLFSEKEKPRSVESILFKLRKYIVNKFKKQNKSPEMIDRWIDNNGKLIKNDSNITSKDKLTIKAVLTAKGLIAERGLDDSNLVMYTSSKAIRDLTLDADLDTYVRYGRPAVITENILERILGVNLISSAVPNTAIKTIKKPENILQKIVRVFWGRRRELIEINGSGKRSVLFIPNVAFGLVSGRDLTMEAQRRNELQLIHVTGTQKITGLVKNVEAIVRISHA